MFDLRIQANNRIANQIYLGFSTEAVRGPTIYKVALLLEKNIIIVIFIQTNETFFFVEGNKRNWSHLIELAWFSSFLAAAGLLRLVCQTWPFSLGPKAFLFEWALGLSSWAHIKHWDGSIVACCQSHRASRLVVCSRSLISLCPAIAIDTMD